MASVRIGNGGQHRVALIGNLHGVWKAWIDYFQ